MYEDNIYNKYRYRYRYDHFSRMTLPPDSLMIFGLYFIATDLYKLCEECKGRRVCYKHKYVLKKNLKVHFFPSLDKNEKWATRHMNLERSTRVFWTLRYNLAPPGSPPVSYARLGAFSFSQGKWSVLEFINVKSNPSGCIRQRKQGCDVGHVDVLLIVLKIVLCSGFFNC